MRLSFFLPVCTTETAAYSQLTRRLKVIVLRKPIWIKEPRFQGYGCSECGWVFKPEGRPAGDSLDEMKEIFERLRNKAFATHVCAEHARAKKTKG